MHISTSQWQVQAAETLKFHSAHVFFLGCKMIHASKAGHKRMMAMWTHKTDDTSGMASLSEMTEVNTGYLNFQDNQ